MKSIFNTNQPNKFSAFWFKVFILCVVAITFSPITGQSQTVFSEDWETGIGNWWVDNGVWEVGVPTTGPGSAHSGQNCVATVLDGNYPGGSNSRLVSPYINLPGGLQSGEQIVLRFWHWFSFASHAFGYDRGYVQISVNNGPWNTISNQFFHSSSIWSPVSIDLTAYADSSIRIGFRILDEANYSGTSSGWYIDDINISVDEFIFNNPENWELGIEDWWVDNGVWEVGVPTTGPGSSHSGQNCAATVLDGNYPGGSNSRLVSPYINLPGGLQPGEQIVLRFWHWFSFASHAFGYDRGYVQISVNNGPWNTISNEFFHSSSIWSPVSIDLTAYADSSIRIGFRILDEANYSGTSSGWYIDDINISVDEFIFNNPENWELGIEDWWVDNGVWEVGVPTTGPDSAHSGQNCVATVLDGNYPSGSNSRLVSPYISLTPISGQFPALYFWHWFSFASHAFGYDRGQVLISVHDGEWQAISNEYSGNSGIWSQVFIDLSAYTDSSIRIGFRILDEVNYSGTSSGWYIDDIRFEGIIITEIEEDKNTMPNEYALSQNYPNPFNPNTKIKYSIPEMGSVALKVFDVLGNEVATLISEEKPAGSYEVEFNGLELSSGIYFYKLQSGSFVETKKMILLK